MPFRIEDKLVVAVASSALFDLSKSDAVFREKGLEAYRAYQRTHERRNLKPGVAFHFVRRLLSLSIVTPDDPPVEVVLLSRNDPDTGLRVMNSIESHGLSITRAAFVNGGNPFRYVSAFNASLFLSASKRDVVAAVQKGLPAGQVLPTASTDDPADPELRIALDFDCVLAGDEAERVFQKEGLGKFHETENERAMEPHLPGPLKPLLEQIGRIQQLEILNAQHDANYKPIIRTAIVTSRNAPAHKRMVTSLRAWGIRVDETFFLGGMDKRRILSEFKPHIFFDDQLTHAGPAAAVAPSVHIPFGPANDSPHDLGSTGRSRQISRSSSAAKRRRR